MICVAELDIDRLIADHTWVIEQVLLRRLRRPVTPASDPELWQRGMIALWEAAKRYQTDRGKFVTWAWAYLMRFKIARKKRGMALQQYQSSDLVLNGLADSRPELDPFQYETTELLESLVDKLNPRSADVVRRRFGLGADVETQKAIGESYGVTAPTISNVQTTAIKNLQRRVDNNPSLGRALRDC